MDEEQSGPPFFKTITIRKDMLVQVRQSILRFHEQSIPLTKIDNIDTLVVARKKLLLLGAGFFFLGVVRTVLLIDQQTTIERLLHSSANTMILLSLGGVLLGLILIICGVIFKVECVRISSGVIHIEEHGAGSGQFAADLREYLDPRTVHIQEKETTIATDDSLDKRRTTKPQLEVETAEEFEEDEERHEFQIMLSTIRSKFYGMFR